MNKPEAALPMDVILGLPLTPRGPSYTLVRLLQGMAGPGLDIRLFAPLDRWTGPPTDIETITGGVHRAIDVRIPYQLFGPLLNRRAEKRLLQGIGEAGGERLVFTWGEVSLALSRALTDRGVRVVREKFNCSKHTAKTILDRAYRALGSEPGHAITERMIEKEREELLLADAVFCPSPMVTRSLEDLGLPRERLLPTSYGWEPARFTGTDRALPAGDGPTVLFVGYVCVRKGAHLLLEAWRRAGIRGRLILAGAMEPLIAERYRDILARDDVQHIAYTENVGALYRSADWFIFPSLEEGGPQVTYEAAGNGLPVIVSPMGAGAFARHGLDGLVVDSEDAQPWAEVIGSLPDRREQRLQFAHSAQAHALHFTYEEVGRRRRELLLERFADAR